VCVPAVRDTACCRDVDSGGKLGEKKNWRQSNDFTRSIYIYIYADARKSLYFVYLILCNFHSFLLRHPFTSFSHEMDGTCSTHGEINGQKFVDSIILKRIVRKY
jgi:hypothetical protein